MIIMNAADEQAKTREDVRVWMENVLGETVPKLTHESLKDGLLLVKLANKALNKNLKAQVSKLPFKQMENVQLFIGELKAIGCPEFEIFQTIDLYENKNFDQVIVALVSFARQLRKQGFNVPSLGPELRDPLKTNFTEKHRLAALNATPLLASGPKITPALFNRPRQIVNPDVDAANEERLKNASDEQ